MDQILLCSNHIPLTTAIHNSFIQKYMLDANGSYVKVYLYLSMCLQHRERSLSISFLADRLENTEKDIIRALHYWEKRGLMSLQTDTSNGYITGIEMLDPDMLLSEEDRQMMTDKPSETKDVVTETVNAEPDYSGTEFSTEQSDNKILSPDTKSASDTKISDIPDASDEAPEKSTPYDTLSTKEISVTEEQTLRVTQDNDFSWVCLIVENYLKRTLNTTEVQLLTYLFDTLHFSKELILYLYEYCCSLEKTNVKYVQTVALSWAELGITTPEEAKIHATIYSASHTAIAKTLALGRPLAKIECQYIERWQNVWHMDLAVILEACNRTMLSIQKPDFKYLDGILSNWHKSNVHTLQDIAACDAKHKQKRANAARQNSQKSGAVNNTGAAKKAQFQSFQQRSTSKEEIDQLEKILLTR